MMSALCACASPAHSSIISFSFCEIGQRRATLDDLRQRLAADVLHHDERRLVELAGVVDVDDVGVVQRGEGAGFAGEPLAQLGGIERRASTA